MQEQLIKLEKNLGIEWQEFNLKELFGKSKRGRRLKSSERIKGILPFVTAGDINMGISAYISNDVTIFPKNTITIDMFGSAKYRNYPYGADDHVAIVNTSSLPESAVLFITSAINKSANAGQFDYSRNFYASDADELTIQLPVNNEKLAINYMEQFIAILKAERIATLKAERATILKAYLEVAGLDSYHLTEKEQELLDNVDTLETKYGIEWKQYRFDQVFEHIVQGRRLKKQDQTKGSLPFVMSGVTNTGIVEWIGNNVRKYPANSLTIDIFGNVFYRNYEYGMGDDTAAYWNSTTPMNTESMLYVAACIKKSLTGKFDYGNKLRGSRTHGYQLSIPTIKKDNKKIIDVELMTLFVSAVRKQVIKDIVLSADKEINLTKGLLLGKQSSNI